MQFTLSKFSGYARGARLLRLQAGSRPPTHLVVIGNARSGTTILNIALNTSPDVCMFGESSSYRDDGEKNFRNRFNAVHLGYGNQMCKLSYAPALPHLPEDADLAAYFAALREHYPVYGEKIALTTPHFRDEAEKIRLWVEKNRAWCLFVFRHPHSTIASMTELFPNMSMQEDVFSYAMTTRLYLDLARILPNVRHVIHENISAETFKSIGHWLGTDLSDAAVCYNPRSAPSRYAPENAEMATLVSAYDYLAQSNAELGAIPPVLAQNGGSLSGKNENPVAILYADLARLMDGYRRSAAA